MRQTITRYWKYDMFLQKTQRVGFNFIKLQKFYYFFELFFNCYRPSHLKIRNFLIKKLWRKNTFRLDEISNYKFINNRNLILNKTLLFFCNLSSRTEIFPTWPQTFSIKNLHFRNEKKIARFAYSFFLYKKNFLAFKFYKLYKKTYKKVKYQTIFKNMFNKIIQIKNWNLNWKKQYRILKIKNNLKNLENFQIKIFIKKNEKKNFSKEKYNEFLKENNIWAMDTQNILNSSLISLQQRNFPPSKQRLHFWKKKNYKMNIKKIFFLITNKLKKNLYKIHGEKIKKNKKILKKLKNYFFFKKIINFNFFFQKKTFLNIKNNKKKYITLKKKKIFIIENLQKKKTTVFWYIQFLNKFLVYEYKYFFKNILNRSFPFKINLFFQQEFSFPQSAILLQIINKKIRIMTNFLKNNKKFYNNFLNIMPTIQTFTQLNILAKQLAIELARTKKHWRVIRGMELIFLQAFIQLRKEPIEGKGGFLGLRIVINGRPNKISRTKKIIFSLGKIKKSNFMRFNVFQSFAPSKAQIGSFGINIIAATN